ncbi:MAG TPA: zinc ribbon domain-containing protein [Terriglobia bacterium]|nr:zinc ribbon domain-containing protein [Terriglobia bacterium]
MAGFVHDAQHEFWQSPAQLTPAPESVPGVAMAEACATCGSEYLIGAKFCHTCGAHRASLSDAESRREALAGFWSKIASFLRPHALWVASSVRKISVPAWFHYLHFHEIKRWMGLPTASLIAFLVGLGCIAGAVGVSFFYKASNLAEFQAIQMWRMEWLLGASASFLAGILLKTQSRSDSDRQ